MRIETTRSYYIYILTNSSKDQFETGVTGDLSEKMNHGRSESGQNGNSSSCNYLIHWEHCEDPLDALNRERQIRNYSRKKKIELIDGSNPDWRFLNEEIITPDHLFLKSRPTN